MLALAAPTLLSVQQGPSSTLLNQLLAVACWGLLLWQQPAGHARLAQAKDAWPVLLVLGLLLFAIGISWAEALPSSIALTAAATLCCAAAVLMMAQCAPSSGETLDAIQPMLTGLLLAGALGALVGLTQVFLPGWTDGWLMASPTLPGRAVGNVRQPNHLSAVLLWALVALVPLAQAGRVHRLRLPAMVAAAIGALMVLGVVLTASRTGMVSMFMLCLWGIADRKLRPSVRWSLALAPLVYLGCWLLVDAWAHYTQHTFGGEVRLGEADLSASRFGIWANAWSLVKMNPWFGVGWGEFNFAWGLTPFPTRPVAFFDHTHNLPIQLAVELGLPLAALLIGLLSWALWLAFRRAARIPGDAGAGARATAMMVLLMGFYSMLEYPLWYVYFLLPTAWAWGHAMRMTPAETRAHPAPASNRRWLELTGALMVLGALFAVWDYQRVAPIYAGSTSKLPLAQRIAIGQRSWLFSHHADYAASVSTMPPSRAIGAIQRASHMTVDSRLLMAWAAALDESGDVGRARYLADRLREFHNPASEDFLGACNRSDIAETLFQCTSASEPLTWHDFVR